MLPLDCPFSFIYLTKHLLIKRLKMIKTLQAGVTLSFIKLRKSEPSGNLYRKSKYLHIK